MDWSLLITAGLPALLDLIKAIPAIKTAWNTGSLSDVTAVIPPSVVQGLTAAGAAQWPGLAPELHAAAAAVAIAHPDVTTYTQIGLNAMNEAGYIKLAAPLTDDGVLGPKTKAAIAVLETKLGIPATGFIVDAVDAAINNFMTTKPA